MAKSKSIAPAKSRPGKAAKSSIEDDTLVQALPFVRDTRGEPFHEKPGLYWWHVSNTNYWHQDLSIGEAFCDMAAALHSVNAEEVQWMLRHSLAQMVRGGCCGGIETGFLNRLLHYASIGMAASGPRFNAPVMTARV